MKRKDDETNAEPMTYTRTRIPRDGAGEPTEVTQEIPEAPASPAPAKSGGRK